MIAAPRRAFVVAIDGPAASGKGTVARRLAERFGFAHLDTGLLYRAVAVKLAERGVGAGAAIDVDLAAALARELSPADLERPELRDEAAADGASRVAAIASVREALLDYQRRFAAAPPDGARGAVLDGRDIGTVICPDADVKLFVDAGLEERARRRADELAGGGPAAPEAYRAVLEDIRARDARDARRRDAPLRRAADAFLLNTDGLDIEAAVAKAASVVESRISSVRAE